MFRTNSLPKKEDNLKIVIQKAFQDDYVSREAGEKLRKMFVTAIQNQEEVIVDFGNKAIASTSFFDEGFAKLSLEKIPSEKIKKFIHLKNIHPRDQEICTILCNKRKK